MIREYEEKDFAVLADMHRRQGLPYPMPNLNDGIFFSKLVKIVNGTPVMALAARLTAETYMLHDAGQGRPLDRWGWFKELELNGCIDVAEKGLQDLHCWVEPQVAKKFGRRLQSLGWKKPEWVSFAKEF